MRVTTLGFGDSEVERLSTCLRKLTPHLRLDGVAIAGGVAIQLRLAEAGHAGPRTSIADLDLVASSVDAVAASAAETFLVSHYHVVQPGVPKFMVQLVDPETRIRVDTFPDLVGSMARATWVRIQAQRVKMLALEDILEHKLLTLSKAAPTKPVDPKHAQDAHTLAGLFGRTVPPIARDCLVEDVYGIDEEIRCERCELSRDPRFPLAPKREILRLLGW